MRWVITSVSEWIMAVCRSMRGSESTASKSLSTITIVSLFLLLLILNYGGRKMLRPDLIDEITRLKGRVETLEKSSQLPNSSGLLRVAATGLITVTFTGTEAYAETTSLFTTMGIPAGAYSVPPIHQIVWPYTTDDDYSQSGDVLLISQITAGGRLGIDAKLLSTVTCEKLVVGVTRSEYYAALPAAKKVWNFRYYIYKESGAL